MKEDRLLRNTIEMADRKLNHPVEYFVRDVAWARFIVPGARLLWRGIERAGPLWAAITAVATALTAWKMIKG